MTDQKNDPTKGPSNQNKGSGSDTASAARISAGTSVGTVGETPMPHSQTGSSGTGAQSSTLASHTSKPMGGQAGPTGAGKDARGSGTHVQSGSQSAQARGQQGQSQGGMSGSAKQAADQLQDKAGEAYEQASEWAQDTYERASSWASDAMDRGSRQFEGLRSRSGQYLGGSGRGVQRYVSENPIMVGLVGLAAGLLLGALLPRTRREDEMFGEWADEVRDQGLRYAHEAAQRGRDYVDENFTGEDARFGRHDSEYRSGSGAPGGNQH